MTTDSPANCSALAHGRRPSPNNRPLSLTPQIWDSSANSANGFREIDIEVARWGLAQDPTAAQFVLTPLKNQLPPGWRVRWPAAGRPTTLPGSGGGSGPCTFNGGSLEFNGAGTHATTCLVYWGAGQLKWACFEGLFTLATLAQAPPSALLAAYTYADAWAVPDARGDSRVHSLAGCSGARGRPRPLGSYPPPPPLPAASPSRSTSTCGSTRARHRPGGAQCTASR